MKNGNCPAKIGTDGTHMLVRLVKYTLDVSPPVIVKNFLISLPHLFNLSKTARGGRNVDHLVFYLVS